MGFLFMEEIWKDIPGYEGYYQASNTGRIKSLDRVVVRECGNCFRKGIVLKFVTHSSTDNYKRYKVGLKKDKKRKTWSVSQLIAMAFLNHVPCGYKLVVNHIDLNPLNNHVDNLELITQRENANQKHLKSKSQYVGVVWDKQRNIWRSSIRVKDKRFFLGSFINEYEAHLSYQKALKEIENPS